VIPVHVGASAAGSNVQAGPSSSNRALVATPSSSAAVSGVAPALDKNAILERQHFIGNQRYRDFFSAAVPKSITNAQRRYEGIQKGRRYASELTEYYRDKNMNTEGFTRGDSFATYAKRVRQYDQLIKNFEIGFFQKFRRSVHTAP
jgi:hypothetical protein